MLNYIAAAIGIVIAIVALVLVFEDNRMRIKFDIASTIDDDGELCFIFRVINNGKVYCKVEQFGLSHMYMPVRLNLFGRSFLFHRLKGQKRVHATLYPPFELQPYEYHDVILKYKVIKKNIKQLYEEYEKIELFVSFVTWKHYYKYANEIRELIEKNYTSQEEGTP